MKSKIPLMIVGGIFLLLDQFLKWQALHAWNRDDMLGGIFGWSPFLNKGVAFSLPVPSLAAIFITVPIVLYLLVKIIKSNGQSAEKILPLVIIFVGAVSNLIDRVVYNATVDYIRFFMGVINLADVLIVVGFVIYFYQLRKKSDVF